MPWSCNSCTIENDDDNAARCDCCGEPRLTLSQETGTPVEFDQHDEDEPVGVHYDFQKDEKPAHKETVNVEDSKMRSNLAVMLKEQGNDYFRKQDWRNAIKFYSNALEHDSLNPHLHLNKAACFLKLQDADSVIDSTNIALQLTGGKNVKAWYRRGEAYLLKGDIFSRFYDFSSAQILDPQDQAIRSGYLLAQKAAQEYVNKVFKIVDEFDSLDEDLTQQALEVTDRVDLSFSTLQKKLSVSQLIGYFYLIRQNQTIKTVDLSNQPIRVDAAISIRKFLEQNRSLEVLILSDCALGAEGMYQISQGIQHTMAVLKVNGNYCRSFGAASLRKACRFVAEIDLSNNSIGDEGLYELLAESAHEDSRLHTLKVTNNRITSDSVSRLIHRLNSSNLGSIKTLDLSDNLFNPLQTLNDKAQEHNVTIITSFQEQTGNPFINSAFFNYND